MVGKSKSDHTNNTIIVMILHEFHGIPNLQKLTISWNVCAGCQINFQRSALLALWKEIHRAPMDSGCWFNIKMSSYQFRKSHYGDKTILRPSYLHNGISYTGKTTSLYWIRAQITKGQYFRNNFYVIISLFPEWLCKSNPIVSWLQIYARSAVRAPYQMVDRGPLDLLTRYSLCGHLGVSWVHDDFPWEHQICP